MTREEAMGLVKEVYAGWEGEPIERSCTGRSDCCRFQQTGKMPYVTRGEALVAAAAWRSAGRKVVEPSADGDCPFLKGGRCQIYEGRPFGCRTHFCAPAGGPAERKQVRPWIRELERVDHALGGDGGVNFVTAVSEAMSEVGRKGRGR